MARDVEAEALARTYRDAHVRLVAEEQRIIADPLQYRRVARLAELQREIGRQMQSLDTGVRDWIGTSLPAVWEAGAQAIGQNFGWTLLHSQGVQQVALRTYDYLLDATRYINASTKALINSIVHDETLAKLTQGETAIQAGRDITARLVQETGLSRIAYANGSLHGLDEYGEMVSRTQSALAYNYGGMQQAIEEQTPMLECFDGDECGWTDHDDPDPADGKIVTVDEAAEYPIAHPNCLRAFAPSDEPPPEDAPDPQDALDEAIASGGKATSAAGQTFAEHAATMRHVGRIAAQVAKVR